jgi:hypothetical protein
MYFLVKIELLSVIESAIKYVLIQHVPFFSGSHLSTVYLVAQSMDFTTHLKPQRGLCFILFEPCLWDINLFLFTQKRKLT